MRLSFRALCVLAGSLAVTHANAFTFIAVPLEQLDITSHQPPPESFSTLGISLGMLPDEVEKIALQEGYEITYKHQRRHCLGDYCVRGNEDKFTFSYRFDKPGSRIYVDFDNPILGGKAIAIKRGEVAENIDIHAVSKSMREKLGQPAGNEPATSHGDYCWAAKDGALLKKIKVNTCHSNKTDTKHARYLMTLYRDKMEIEIADLKALNDQRKLRDGFNKIVSAEKNKQTAPATTPKL